MKTIKIFLASSEELEYDRNVFGNLVRRLDDLYEKRGIRIKLFEWEDYDAAYNDRRKQDEYNDKVRESDLFFVLFYKKAGKFSIEEFDVALEEYNKHASPKVFIFCKDLQPDEEQSSELAEFKKRLFDEIGHYWCRYDSRESLQLQFVMQLQLVENSHMSELRVEDGNVTLNGMRIASMDKLRFAASNEDYIKMSEELAALPEKIEKARLRLEKYPSDEDLKDDLQQKLNRYNKLKEEFEQFQQLLFNTAKHMAQLQSGRVTQRMRRAMDAFCDGRVHDANVILSEAEADAKRNLELLIQGKTIVEDLRQNVITSIEELQMSCNIVMADVSMPIEERIDKTNRIFVLADEMAQKADLDKDDYLDLLIGYGAFLQLYCAEKYMKAFEVLNRSLELSEELYDEEDPKTAMICSMIAQVCLLQGKRREALKYLEKTIDINEKNEDASIETAYAYHNSADIYVACGEYQKAIELYEKGLDVICNIEDSKLVRAIKVGCFRGIGNAFYYMGNCEEAMKFYQEALSVEITGDEDPYRIMVYNSIGDVYLSNGEPRKALEQRMKALDLSLKYLGEDNLGTAATFFAIAEVYNDLNDSQKTLDFCKKALRIIGKIGGNPMAAGPYELIGKIHYKQGHYSDALDYYCKALEICESFQIESPGTADVYNSIGNVYYALHDYNKALEYYKQAINVHKTISLENNDTATYYNNVFHSYKHLNESQSALEYRRESIAIRERIGESVTAEMYNTLGVDCYNLQEYDDGLQYFQKALEVQNQLDVENLLTASIKNNIGNALRGLGKNKEALEYYWQALDIHKRLGVENWLTASINNNIGNSLYSLGEYKESSAYFREAIETHKKLGVVDAFTATINNNMGNSLYSLEEYEESLAYYREAIEIHKKLGVVDAFTATINDNMGDALDCLKKNRESLDYRKEALAVRERIGESITSETYNAIGIDCYNLQEYQEALQYFQKALEVQNQLDVENLLTASIKNNIGNALRGLGKNKEALEYYRRALDIHKRLCVEDSQIVTIYKNMGLSFYELGQYENALESILNALDLCERLNPSGLDSIYLNIFGGTIYSKLGNYREALNYHQKALCILEEQYGNEESILAMLYHNVASDYHDLKEYHKAKEFYQKALAVHLKLEIENADTALFYNNLGALFCDMGEYQAAMEYHKKALEIRKLVLGANHYYTGWSYKKIGIVYNALGDYSNALIYYQKALETLEKSGCDQMEIDELTKMIEDLNK